MSYGVIRVYADTSVYGGVFDAEFAHASDVFFQQVRDGRFVLVTSEVVRDEIAPAPPKVRKLFAEMLPLAELVTVTAPILALYRSYIAEHIVPAQSAADALHVAAASISRCTILASWNCKHIVHFDKIPKFNAVNTLCGIAQIAIHTPLEVIQYE